ncbi:hypothetical protein [Streptosporangium sp. NPDC004631]
MARTRHVEGVVRLNEAEERFAWLDAVEHAGGAVVLIVDSHDWETLASGRSRADLCL